MLYFSNFVLDLCNKQKNKIMKNAKLTPATLISFFVVILSLLILVIVKENIIQKGIDLLILSFVVTTAIIALFFYIQKNSEQQSDQPEDDEMTLMIKYKAGYKAYMASMYLWLFIFLFRNKFPDIESMIGGGILLSAAIFFITKYLVKKELDA